KRPRGRQGRRRKRVAAAVASLAHAGGGLLRDGLWVVGSLQELARGLLRVVEVYAGLDRLMVLVHGARAVAHRVVRVASLDVRPRLYPRRLQVAVQRGVEVVERLLVVA